MFDLITFGEAMIRLSPPNYKRLEQAGCMDVNVGGGVMNVAVAGRRLGLKTSFATRVPANPLGRMVENKTREQGVDTSFFVWGKDERLGLYFTEFGALPRPSSVLYDRAHSAIANIKEGMIDWEAAFNQAKAFHVSGITPALSANAAHVTATALKTARKKRLVTSFDLNYRAKLWSEEEARKILTPMMKFTEILITTEEDTWKVFKIKEKNYKAVAERLHKIFGFKVVAITLRKNVTVLRNQWTAIAYDGKRFFDDKVYDVEIIDRVGSGDSFTAGFLYAYLSMGKDLKKALQYGNALSAIKHSIPGDLNWTSLGEVEALVKGGGSLRISR